MSGESKPLRKTPRYRWYNPLFRFRYEFASNYYLSKIVFVSHIIFIALILLCLSAVIVMLQNHLIRPMEYSTQQQLLIYWFVVSSGLMLVYGKRYLDSFEFPIDVIARYYSDPKGSPHFRYEHSKLFVLSLERYYRLHFEDLGESMMKDFLSIDADGEVGRTIRTDEVFTTIRYNMMADAYNTTDSAMIDAVFQDFLEWEESDGRNLLDFLNMVYPRMELSINMTEPNPRLRKQQWLTGFTTWDALKVLVTILVAMIGWSLR